MDQQSSRFDLQLEEWGVDVVFLKESAVTRNFVGWTEERGKEKHKKNDAVVRALFVNKYNNRSYRLPAQSDDDVDHTYFIREEDIVWCRGKDGGWTIFGQCQDPDIEEDKITPFLAVTLIRDTVQAEGIRVKKPDTDSPDWDVYDPDLN